MAHPAPRKNFNRSRHDCSPQRTHQRRHGSTSARPGINRPTCDCTAPPNPSVSKRSTDRMRPACRSLFVHPVPVRSSLRGQPAPSGPPNPANPAFMKDPASVGRKSVEPVPLIIVSSCAPGEHGNTRISGPHGPNPMKTGPPTVQIQTGSGTLETGPQ